MKHYACGSLVPGCEWQTRDEDEAEVIRRAVDHMHKAHGETEVRPEMIERIKERIKDTSDVA